MILNSQSVTFSQMLLDAKILFIIMSLEVINSLVGHCCELFYSEIKQFQKQICDAIKQNESELEKTKNTDFCFIVSLISQALYC